jgi:MFS family permease
MMLPNADSSCRCSVNTQLLPGKLVYFFWLFSNGGLEPYFPLILSSMGMTAAQVGIFGVVIPLATFFGSPMWGAVADRTHSHRLVLLTTFGCAALVQ